MSKQTNKIRIKDIAELAGVSEGTVDRVLHNRGDVSEKSRQAVKKVLDEMNYTPNILARSLASKKQFHFVCLFPEYKQGEYWETVDKGFAKASQDFMVYNVHIEKCYFNQFDAQSFVAAASGVPESEPDAVFISPIFREETIHLTNELTKRNIRFSFIDSKIDEEEYLTYYGQNSFLSGYIAAKLLLSTISGSSQILVIRTYRKGAVSNQTISRSAGFLKYIEEHKPENQIELINIELQNEDEEANREVLKQVFEKNEKIAGAITFNSRVYRLARHLNAIGKTNVVLIGYDLLDGNVKYLKEGVVSYLIAQRPEKQAYFTVRDMCRELIFNQEVNRINYVPVDILIKENIEDYRDFTD